MTEIGRDSFHLKKVKKTKVGGLEITYSGNGVTVTTEDKRVAHPELIKRLDYLPGYVAKIVEVESGRIKVTGASISGTDDTKGLIITSTLGIEAGNTSIALNSPRILLEKNIYGFEEELAEHVDILTDEVYAYLFKGKQAQLEIFPVGEADPTNGIEDADEEV